VHYAGKKSKKKVKNAGYWEDDIKVLVKSPRAKSREREEVPFLFQKTGKIKDEAKSQARQGKNTSHSKKKKKNQSKLKKYNTKNGNICVKLK